MAAVPKFVRIDGHEQLIRDTHSMGIINTNSRALEVAKRKQAEAMKQVREATQHKADLNSLRSEVVELKSLLLQVLQREK